MLRFMRRPANYLLSLMFAVATMLAVKFTHPWLVALGITFAAAVVTGEIRERLDPVIDDEDDEDDD